MPIEIFNMKFESTKEKNPRITKYLLKREGGGKVITMHKTFEGVLI